MRKCTWLTTDDVEDHFADLCSDVPMDPFAGTARFIKTFADRVGYTVCMSRLTALQRGLQPRGGPSDAD